MNDTNRIEMGSPVFLSREELRALDAMDFGVKLSPKDIDLLAERYSEARVHEPKRQNFKE